MRSEYDFSKAFKNPYSKRLRNQATEHSKKSDAQVAGPSEALPTAPSKTPTKTPTKTQKED